MYRRSTAICVTLASGCDLVMGLEARDPAASCPGAGIADTFEQAPACAPWGRAMESNATLEITDGDLVVGLGAGASARGGCTSFLATGVGPDGVTLGLGVVSAAPSAVVQLALVPEQRADVAAALQLRADRVFLVETATGVVTSLELAGAAPRALRLRPAPDGVVGEVAIGDDTWLTVGTVSGTPPVDALITFAAITTAAEPMPSTTSFTGVRLCAP